MRVAHEVGPREGPATRLEGAGWGLAAFTVGDRLLWGAAEPLRRTLQLLREQLHREQVTA